MSTHTLDTIGRKIDALIDVLLGRPTKVKGPTNEELAEIVKQWENAAPGVMVDVPDGVRWPPIGRACDQPEAITTELECAGIDQYAIEIEQAGRRIRYEAPSVDGVRELMRMNHEHKWWVESANAQAEFEQAQIDRAVEKFEAEKQRGPSETEHR